MVKIFHYNSVEQYGLLTASSFLTILEYRIIILALAQVKTDYNQTWTCHLKIHDILNKDNSSNYYLVYNAAKKLHKSLLVVQENEQWRCYNFIDSIDSIEPEMTHKYLKIAFYEGAQEYLFSIKKRYHAYMLNKITSFRTIASFYIYELCKTCAYALNGIVDLFTDDLRTLFSFQLKYRSYTHFKEKILYNAIKEINRYSDIIVDFKEIKLGRKFDKIQFIFTENPAYRAQKDFLRKKLLS